MSKPGSLTSAFVVVFLAGAAVRAVDLVRPADGRIREGWRESDYAALARSFYREGMDILSPRVEWRGDGPGLAEMELPLVPWLTAGLYRIFGPHELLGRVVSYLFSLLTLLAFAALARSLLPPAGAVFALAFLALAPLSVRVSNALQPESAMLFFYVSAVWAFSRWLKKGGTGWYAGALAATALAILVKAPAAHIGLLFVFLIVAERGVKGLFRPAILAFGALALLPAAAWGLHAHRYWLIYGNSLGVSNEYHWIGWDLIRQPRLILAALSRLVRMEATLSAMIPGLLLAPFALWPRRREAPARIGLFWLAAVAVYYILAIRTTGDFWASYYHVVSVPPFALAFGLAYAGLESRIPRPAALRTAALVSFAAGTGLIVLRALSPGARLPAAASTVCLLAAALAGGLLLVSAPARAGEGRRVRLPGAAGLVAAALLALLPLEGLQTARDLRPSAFTRLYACAEAFRPLIPEGARILVSGGPRTDESGRPVAYNASYFFYWLDRKGFSLPAEDQTLEAVAALAARGAEYLVLEDAVLKARPGFKAELARAYPLLAERPEAALFKIR